MPREDGGPRGPVALAEEVAGRVPAVVLAQKTPHELRQRSGVLVDAPVVGAGRVAQGVAEPRPDRVDHDDVRDVEEGVGVVLERVRRRALRTDVGRDDPPRTHDPHVQPEGCRSRPAVVGEDERPLAGRVAVGAEVGRVEELGRGVAVVVREGRAGDRCVVFDRLAADHDRVAALPAGGLGGGVGLLGDDRGGRREHGGGRCGERQEGHDGRREGRSGPWE